MHEPFQDYFDDDEMEEDSLETTSKDLLEFYDLLAQSGTRGVGGAIPFIMDYFSVNRFTATNMMMNWLIHFSYHVSKN